MLQGRWLFNKKRFTFFGGILWMVKSSSKLTCPKNVNAFLPPRRNEVPQYHNASILLKKTIPASYSMSDPKPVRLSQSYSSLFCHE